MGSGRRWRGHGRGKGWFGERVRACGELGGALKGLGWVKKA